MEKCIPALEMTSLLFLLLLAVISHQCYAMQEETVNMDRTDTCPSSTAAVKTYWATEKKAILVIGRSHANVGLRDCSIVVGAATTASSLLRLNFQAFHIRDCGVVLSVNQSSGSSFQSGGSPMVKMGCDHGNIQVLHTEEKHYVKINLRKTRLDLLGYSFRINITVTDKGLDSSIVDHPNPVTEMMYPGEVGNYLKSEHSHRLEAKNLESPVNTTNTHDTLPETGVATHVVVIVGAVVLAVVGVGLWLLVKYLMRRTVRWQEQLAARNMERAIQLYNDQEPPPAESHCMYTALPPAQASSADRVHSQHGRPGHQHHGPGKKGGSRSSRQRAGDITFVHVDGHIETFRMRGNQQDRRDGDGPLSLNTAPLSHRATPPPHPPPPHPPTEAPLTLADPQDSSMEGIGEFPPSYEEAIHMPTPRDLRSPLYENLHSSKADDNHTT